MYLKVLLSVYSSGNMPKYERAQEEINSPQEAHDMSMRNLRNSYEIVEGTATLSSSIFFKVKYNLDEKC